MAGVLRALPGVSWLATLTGVSNRSSLALVTCAAGVAGVASIFTLRGEGVQGTLEEDYVIHLNVPIPSY